MLKGRNAVTNRVSKFSQSEKFKKLMQLITFYSFRKGDKREALDEYILFASLPYTVTESDAPAKRDYLEMVANTVITRDMIDRYDIRYETKKFFAE